MEPQVAALLEDARGAAAAAPEDAAAWLAYGEVLHAHELAAEAAACYREAARLADPSGLTALAARYLLAHAVRGSGPAESAAALEAALADHPGYLPARVLLGEVRDDLGDRAAALEAFRQAAAADPGAPLAAFRLGSALLAEGRVGEAIPLLRSATAGAPEAGAAHTALARAHYAAGERALAEAAAGRAAAAPARLPSIEDPIHHRMTGRDRSSPRLLDLAGAARAEGRWAEAESRYRDLAALRPRDALVLAEFGAALAGRGKDDEAERRYLDALALDPGQALARFGLGVLRARAGDYPGAEFQFRASLRARPDHPAALAGLGETLLRQRRYAEALEALRRAAEFDPESGGVRLLEAAALAELGRFEEAWAAVRAAAAREVEASEEFLAALRAKHPEPGG